MSWFPDALAFPSDSGAPPRRRAAIIGKFDGVHRGHQQLLTHLFTEGRKRGLDVGVIMLYPDPITVLRPEIPRRDLMSLEGRIAALLAFGLDFVVPWNFTLEFASLRAAEFLAILSRNLHIEMFLMGPDQCVGHDRQRVDDLADASRQIGIELMALPQLVGLDDEVVSSSGIRSDIQHGRLEEAAVKLTRPLSITGLANNLGQSAHANGSTSVYLHHSPCQVLPPDGDYSGWLMVQGIGHYARAAIRGHRICCLDVHGIDGDLVDELTTFLLLQRTPSEVGPVLRAD